MDLIPKVKSYSGRGIWSGRSGIKAVLLKRHDLNENLLTVKEEFFKNNVSVEPEKWLLLIEAHKRKYNFEIAPIENQFSEAVIDEHGIKAEDPIINPFSSNISDLANISRVNAAKSVLVLDYLIPNNRDLQGLLSDENLRKELLKQSIESVAKQFDVKANDLRREYLRLPFLRKDLLRKNIDQFLDIRQSLIDTSNDESRKKLTSIMHWNLHPNIFIIAGGAHEPIFSPFYVLSKNKTNVGTSEILNEDLEERVSLPLQFSAIFWYKS